MAYCKNPTVIGMDKYNLWNREVYEPYRLSRFHSRRLLDRQPDRTALACLVSEMARLLRNIELLLSLLTASPIVASNRLLAEARQLASLYYRSRSQYSFLHWCVELKYDLTEQLNFCLRRRIVDFVNAVPIGGSEPRSYNIEPIVEYACSEKLYWLTAEQIYERFVHQRLAEGETA